MSAPAFGELVPCRMCGGTGLARNPEWGDGDAARERQRQKRHGAVIPPIKETVRCVECQGDGYLRPADADRRRDDREDLIVRSVHP